MARIGFSDTRCALNTKTSSARGFLPRNAAAPVDPRLLWIYVGNLVGIAPRRRSCGGVRR
jgi:hypothetical protein